MIHIHYKFSSKLSYDTVVFDGLHVTLSDLKRQIMSREKLRAGDCDLQITNAQTKEEYTDDEGLIPKGSSVIVRRIPTIGGRSSSSSKTNRTERLDRHVPHGFGVSRAMSDQSSTKALPFFSKMQMANLADADVSEEDKIRVMINQSSLNLNTKHGTVLPENYTCYRCGNTGHHIRNCPTSGDKNFEGPPKIKKSTGIPRSFMVEVDDPNIKGVMLTNSGRYAIPAIDAEAYAVGKKEKPPFMAQEKHKTECEEEPIPDELVCLICHDLLSDAVVIPCCGKSYCDDCIRSALLDSEEHVCPTCGLSDVSPDALVANKFLRQAVNNFKKERGGTKKVGTSSLTSNSKTLTPAPTPVPTPPPVSAQIQLNKPLKSPCSQKDSLLSHPKAAKPTSVTKGPDVPHEATNPASAENSSNASPQLVESQALISNNEDEEKTGDDLAAVAPFLAVSDKDPKDAPKQLEPQVNSTEDGEPIQTVCMNQRNSSSDSALGLSFSSNSWESTCSSSAPTPGGSTEPSTEQHQTSSSFSSYSATPSPLFSSPPLHTFVSTPQPHGSYPPGYPQTTPTWKLPAPRGAPIPSLCPPTCTSSVPSLIPKEWYRCEGKKRERSPHRRSSSHSKFPKPKPSRSYSRSSSRSASRSRSRSHSRSRSRSRPRSPPVSHRNFQSLSNPSCSYGYKRPSSHTSSSSPRGGHSRSKSHHRKSRHHSKRSSSSSHSSKRLEEAGPSSNTADTSSLELERQRYLQWKEEFKEWYDKFCNLIIQFQQMPLPPSPPSPYHQDSPCPPQNRGASSPPSSETSSYNRSPPSQSSSDTHSTASHISVDSCSSNKANHRYSSPSQSSNDSHSTPSEARPQPKEFSESCTEKLRPGAVTKNSMEANSQDITIDPNQQTLKDVEDSSYSNHEQKKKYEGGRAEALDFLGPKSDLRHNKRCNAEPNASEEGHPGPIKASESIQLPLKMDKHLDKHSGRKDKVESHLKKKQSRRIRQDLASREDMERNAKVNTTMGPDRVATERKQPGSSQTPDSISEVTRKRKRGETNKNERKGNLTVKPQSSKGPKTKPAEPQSHDSKCLKLSDRKKQKPEKEESKTLLLTPRNIWEGGMKVIPQKKISININLDGIRKEEKTNSSNVKIQTQEAKDPTRGTEEKLNKDETKTKTGEKKESSFETLTKDKSVLHMVKEISDKVTFGDESERKAKEKQEDERKEKEEDLDLWHCALTCVEDSDESLMGTEAEQEKDFRDKMFRMSKTEESTRREPRGEPRKQEDVPVGSSSQRNKTLHVGRTSASKNDSSTLERGSCGVEESRQKKTVIKTHEESSQDRAEVKLNLPAQVSRSRWENDGKQQTEIFDSAAGPLPSVTVTNCEATKDNEQQRQRRDRDRVTDRGREKEKERHSISLPSDVAPPGGGERTDSSACPKRDKETKTEKPKERERPRESENQKEKERLKQGTREEERRREDALMQKRNLLSSSSVWYDKERRDRMRGSEPGSSIMSWKTFKESRYQHQPDHRPPDLMSKKESYHFHHYNYHQSSSANYRERNRPDRTQHSPPSPCYEDKDLLLFESTENSEKGCPGGALMQNKSRNESKAQKGEEKSEKTPKTQKDCKGGRETPEAADCRGRGAGGGGGSQREEKARKVEERRRSSSDSVRSSSSHKNDRDDRREETKEKQKQHNRLQEVNT